MRVASPRSEIMKKLLFFVLLISVFTVACTVQSDTETLMEHKEQSKIEYEKFLSESGLQVIKFNIMIDEEHYGFRNVVFLNENELLVMKMNNENLRNRIIKLLDINSSTLKQIYEGELSEDPNHLSILNVDDNNILISGYEAALVISRDQASFDEIRFERDIWANAFLPDGNLLCFDNGKVYIFDLNSREIQHLLDIRPAQNLLNCWFKINSDGTEALFVAAKANYELDVYRIDLVSNSFKLIDEKGSVAFWMNENILLAQEGVFLEYPAKLKIMNQDDVVAATKNYSNEESISIIDVTEDLILINIIDKTSSGNNYLQILDNNLNELYRIPDLGYLINGSISSSSRKIAFITYTADDGQVSLCMIDLDNQEAN